MTRKALIARRAQSDREGPLMIRHQMATRVSADQDGTDCEEGAEWLRGRRVTRKVVMMRRVQSGQ